MSKRAIADYPREAADSLGSPLALRRARGTGGPEARALHDDLVGAVSEAVQRAVGEDGIVEEGHPVLHRGVTRDDRGGPAMALDEHIVEIAAGELAQAEVVEEAQVRREPAPQFPLEGIIGPGLMERLQELGDGDAADAVAGAAGTEPEGAGEEGLPHADVTAEDDLLLLGQPVQPEELADAGAIEADRAVPHDRSKVAVSSKAACSSRRVRPWLARGWISSWSKSSRNSTWLSFPWRA